MSLIFVSHASDDKELFVRPLAHALKSHGLRVWYDEFSLQPGDSLRRSIDRGLSECTAGLVVISPSFFAKEWPQRELDALFTSEVSGRSRLIPIWYQINFEMVAAASPLLADRFAIRGDLGVKEIASKIAELFPVPAKISGDELAGIIESYQYPNEYAGEAQLLGCQYRFLKLNALKEDYQEIVDAAFSKLEDEKLDLSWSLEENLKLGLDELRKKYRIPNDVYITTDEPVNDNRYSWFMQSFAPWISGTMSTKESAEFVLSLDFDELDEYYILLNVPNYSISTQQRPLLEKALVELGSGYQDSYEKLSPICASLRALDQPNAR